MSICVDHVLPFNVTIINLEIPEHAYFFGFCQTDGHLRKHTRNRGCLLIELQKQDSSLLQKCQAIFPVSSTITERIRNTNFKNNYSSVTLNFYDFNFRTELENLGMLVGKKSEIIKTPIVKYSEKDYWRGVIDGDGSLGITKTNIPFISLTTKSEYIKDAFVQYCYSITCKLKKPNRNKRDNVYNIMYTREAAQNIVKELYYDNCFGLDRKIEKANYVLSWKRLTK